MAKTTRIAAIYGCIDYKGQSHVAGGEPFDCDTKEANRLIELGVAALPDIAEKTIDPAGIPGVAAFELLAAIDGAQTVEELTALMPAEEPAAEIVAAFEAKMIELSAA